jgi:hypothetical protein
MTVARPNFARPNFARLALALSTALVAGLVVLATGPGPVVGPPAAAAAAAGPSVRPTDVLMAGSHGPANSLDWAGYAVTGTSLTSASGSWTQPGATCSDNKASQSAFWVGIDGYASSDPTVQQVGTDADCAKGTKKVPGGPSYYAWYELYPDTIVTLGTSTHPVTPGDSLSASVSGSGSTFTLTLVDAGRWTFSTVQVTPTPPLDASAEWIAEAPSTCKASKCKAVDLTDFGTVAFTGASANGLSVNSGSFTDHQITMTKNKKGSIVKASTSALSGGSAFTVTWVSS